MRLGNVLSKFTPEGFSLARFKMREQLRMMKIGAKEFGGKFYAAAHPGINRPHAPQMTYPDDYRQAYERIIMIRYGRQMEDDIPYIESILSDFETYVVGDLRYKPMTGNPEANKVIGEFLEWQFAEADYSGKQDLHGLAKLAIRSKKRDGENGFAYVDVGDAIKLAPVEGDCIGNPLMSSTGAENDFNGIVVDLASNRPIEYKIWRRLPKLNAYVFDRTIPANQFIHFFDPFRFSQQHGVTAFKNGIARSIDVEQAIQFAIQNMKFRSSQLPAIQNEQGRPKAPGSGYVAQPANSNGVPQPFQLSIDGVTQNFLKLGEGYVEYPHDFPNAQFSNVTEQLKGDVALGVHLPPEFCFRSEAGGVLQRFYIEKAQRTFDEEKRLMRRNILNPYKNRVLQKGIDTGFLDLSKFPGLSESMARFSGNWHMGRSVSTDYGNDTDSDIKLIDANLMSPEEHAGDNARDLEEIRDVKRRRAREIIEDAQAVAEATGVEFETALPFIQKQFPNPQVSTRITDNVDATDAPTAAGGGGGGGPVIPGLDPSFDPAKDIVTQRKIYDEWRRKQADAGTL